MAAILAFAVATLAAARRAQRRGDLAAGALYSYGAYAAALSLSAFIAFPVIDRGQDLATLAAAVRADTRQQPLALLVPDETTLAIIDHGHAGAFSVLDRRDPAAVRAWFAARGPQARLLVLLPGHAAGALTHWLARWHPPRAPRQRSGRRTGDGRRRLAGAALRTARGAPLCAARAAGDTREGRMLSRH